MKINIILVPHWRPVLNDSERAAASGLASRRLRTVALHLRGNLHSLLEYLTSFLPPLIAHPL